MTDTKFWDSRRGYIRTKKGGWRIGEAIYCYDFSLLDDLVGKVSYFQILILNITGLMPEPRLAKWLEAAYSCMSYPDPRIWCNQIGSLAGSARTSPMAGITAGIQASDSRMYGPGTANDVCKFLQSAMSMKNNGAAVGTIINQYSRRPNTNPSIPGFGRPLATGDERVERMEAVTKDLGYQKGNFQLLAEDLQNYLVINHGERMNLATYITSFLFDQNWNVEVIRQVTSIMVAAGVAACFSEAYENPPGAFLPLRCDDIEYKGPPPRPVPDRNSD